MLGKLVVLCFCLALASAKPASRVRFSPHHFGLVKTCDTDAIVSAAKSIAEETITFGASMSEEIVKVKAGFDLCSNALDILLCISKGVKEITTNVKLMIGNVDEYMSDMKTQVPDLIADVKACL